MEKSNNYSYNKNRRFKEKMMPVTNEMKRRVLINSVMRYLSGSIYTPEDLKRLECLKQFASELMYGFLAAHGESITNLDQIKALMGETGNANQLICA